jgi:DNA-binding MarR family transcriptional regulator
MRTAIDPSSMVSLIDELEAMELAERRPHPGDRRAHTIFLTDLGRQRLESARARAEEPHDEFFAALTVGERRTLHGLLRKLAAPES